MPTPTIDSLFSTITTPTYAPAKSSSARGDFNDLFGQVLASSHVEKPIASKPTAPAPKEESSSAPAESDSERHESDTEAPVVNEAAVGTEASAESPEAETADDAVEISVEAAAAAEGSTTNESEVDDEIGVDVETATNEEASDEQEGETSGEENGYETAAALASTEGKTRLEDKAKAASEPGTSNETVDSVNSNNAVTKDETSGGELANREDVKKQQQALDADGVEEVEEQLEITTELPEEDESSSRGGSTRRSADNRTTSSENQTQVAQVPEVATKVEGEPSLDRTEPTSTTVSPTTSVDHAESLASQTARSSVQPSATDAVTSETQLRDTPTVDSARFLGRVSGAFKAAQLNEGRIQVRLSPPELGLLRVEITVHQGSLNASLETETNAARNLILENLPALKERLAELNIRIETFDVDVRDEGQQSRQQQLPDDRRSQQAKGSSRRAATSQRDNDKQTNSTVTTAELSGATDTGLDIRI